MGKNARMFGQDLMRGEHVVGGGRPMKGPADGRTNLTWVGGSRSAEDLDDTSRKNLAAQPASGTSIFDPVL